MLTDLKITRTKPDPTKTIRLSDGDGLHLRILPDGRRSWRWDYTFHGRRKQLSFGKYPRVTLKQARAKQAAALTLLEGGTDPSAARKREKLAATTDTFTAVAEEWLEREAATIGPTGAPLSPRTIAKKRAQLDRYLLPALGPLTISKILPADVWPVLKAIEQLSKRETAHRVRQLASEIFRFAVTTSRATSDPAAVLGDALKPVQTRNHPSLIDPVAVGGLLTAIEYADGSPFIVGALRLAPLVFLRSSELRKAAWTEIDLDRAMWRIPAARMKPAKDRIDHLVPLSRQAVSILRDLKAIAGTKPLVFPGLKSPDRAISDATLPTVLRRLGYSQEQQSIHGFRTLASTHLREIGFENDLVELQLSHKIANPVRAAYDKAARVPERVRMMQAWADHLDDLKAGRVRAFTGQLLEMPQRQPAAV
jgi:integrase